MSTTNSSRDIRVRTGLVVGCAVLLAGGAGLALHPLLHHDDHGGSSCTVCLHVAANPASVAPAPELPPLEAALRRIDDPAPGTGSLDLPASRSRAPPGPFADA